MSASSGPTEYVRLSNDLLQKVVKWDFLADFGRLHIRRETDGSLLITTEDRYQRTRPPGVDTVLIARGPDFDAEAVRRVGQLTPITDSTPQRSCSDFGLCEMGFAQLRVTQNLCGRGSQERCSSRPNPSWWLSLRQRMCVRAVQGPLHTVSK
jgi:hypothetical protein